MATFNGNAENIENNLNKVTTVNENSTDEQYPTAKCLYDNLNDIGEGMNGITERLGLLETQKVLWNGSDEEGVGGFYMHASQTITLPQAISEQANGIVLVFQNYANGQVALSDFNTFFIPKQSVADNSGQGRCFICTTTVFGYVGVKYIYISDTELKGHDKNTETGTAASGITYTNNRFVLTKVYGI